ncbi:MAG: PspA/IM30 family protein [Deltaproteobacteria bacterium]|nr:MAG: PspA/IM30 family protein [Deltaproteobacteria bacterium]
MGIMTRCMRLFKADIHGVMDQLEDKGLLLKQHLRDMEEALACKETRVRKLVASRDQAQRDYEKYTRECEKMDQDVVAAIEKNKDDIARQLIKKLKPLSYLRDELGRHIEALKLEIIQLREDVDHQRLQYEQIRLRSRDYFQRVEREQWTTVVSATIPVDIAADPTEEEVELELLKRKDLVNPQ